MSRQPVTLDTLGLAISSLRQKGPHPNLANELAIDVVPIVRAMGDALRGAVEHMEHSTPQGAAAAEAARAALTAFDAGRAPAPTPTEESPA